MSARKSDPWRSVVRNIISGPGGIPAMVDPAAHFGWAEAELAMTSLFGQFDSEAYIAYERIRPLVPGYRDRVDIYNLYHLLNHLNIFGSPLYGRYTLPKTHIYSSLE